MTESRWIPIGSQKPKFDEPVLIVDSRIYLSIEIARLSTITTVANNNGTSESLKWHRGYSAIDEYCYTPPYWMPLPDWPTNMEEQEND